MSNEQSKYLILFITDWVRIKCGYWSSQDDTETHSSDYSPLNAIVLFTSSSFCRRKFVANWPNFIVKHFRWPGYASCSARFVNRFIIVTTQQRWWQSDCEFSKKKIVSKKQSYFCGCWVAIEILTICRYSRQSLLPIPKTAHPNFYMFHLAGCPYFYVGLGRSLWLKSKWYDSSELIFSIDLMLSNSYNGLLCIKMASSNLTIE